MANSMLPHQELAVRYGIRVGEAVNSNPLVEDGIFEKNADPHARYQ